MSKGLRIIFMGTPEFAQGVLQQILESKHQVLAVVTAPDRPAGRGQKIKKSAVKAYSELQDIEVLQPVKFKEDGFIEKLKSYEADLFVVVAFRMLPQAVWSLPQKGTINLHASLLPNYRGAAPINWAIINGESYTGVTTFFINENIDTGDIIQNKKVNIPENMNVGELHDVLLDVGSKLVVTTLDAIESAPIVPQKQEAINEKSHKHAPKIFKEDCKIDWSLNSNEVHNKIRGLSPYPGAWCSVSNQTKGTKVKFKLFSSKITDQVCEERKIGIKSDAEGILFPCHDRYLCVDQLQMEGKRRMTFKEFLAGNTIEEFELILE